MKQKLLFDVWLKTYSIINVTIKCFDISPSIETAGSMTGIKIRSQEHLNFLIKECENKGFKLEV